MTLWEPVGPIRSDVLYHEDMTGDESLISRQASIINEFWVIHRRTHTLHTTHRQNTLPDELNAFYIRFEASNTEACMRAPAFLDDCVITVSVTDVSKTFKQVNIHKAAGPDRLPGCILRSQTNWQVCFSLSLSQFISIQGLYWHGKHVLTLPKQVK